MFHMFIIKHQHSNASQHLLISDLRTQIMTTLSGSMACFF